MKNVTVLGAGLSGSECAWQLAKRGIRVRLVEMKPKKMTPAHTSPYFAELVCSNSLRSDELTNAVGLLKAEMRKMDSLILESADRNRVAAGGALAVDREGFASYITEKLINHPNVEFVSEVLHQLRTESVYSHIVDDLVEIPNGADMRHTKAVKRTATAYLKLLFPHVKSSEQIDKSDFNAFCLQPAIRRRDIIRQQCSNIDAETSFSKPMPEYRVAGL